MGREIHVFFLPFMAQGHLIPMVDIAKLFASRGVKATIVTTPVNASSFSNTIERSKESGIHVGIEILDFPAADVGLPKGCENPNLVPGFREGKWEMLLKFMQALGMLQEPFEKLLQERKPDCLVADMSLPWATDVANKFGIPRLVFQATCYFSMCAAECIRLYQPYKKVQSDTETFVVPDLPGGIGLTRNQLPDYVKQDLETDEVSNLLKASKEAELRSYGVIVNSFYELEPTYADYYRDVLGKKAWHVGPVSLYNKAEIDKAERGKKPVIAKHECLGWLDSKKPNSVLYICFGSMCNFPSNQLKEIATAVEASDLQFIWVVKKQKKIEEEDDDWLPEGFLKRTEGKGLIIRGWAPQVLILEHEAIGGFVTHCGWNSTLEGICAGVPMVTWPVFAEQFYNEKLVTQVLKMGVGVGAQRWVRMVGDFVRKEAIEKALKEVMEGDEADEMRNRAKALAQAAKKAIEGGSSHSDLDSLIRELSSPCD